MPRGSPHPGPTVPVTVGLRPHQARAVDVLAGELGLTRSAVIRRALAAFPPLREVLDRDREGLGPFGVIETAADSE